MVVARRCTSSTRMRSNKKSGRNYRHSSLPQASGYRPGHTIVNPMTTSSRWATVYEQAVEKSHVAAQQAYQAIKDGLSGYLAAIPVPEWGITASVAVESTKDVFNGQDDKGIAKCIDSQISNIIFGGTPRQRTSVFADVRPEAFSRLVREMIGLLIESD